MCVTGVQTCALPISDDEFMAMYEQYEAFDELEEAYLEMEEQVTALIASYVDDHLELFAKIIK